METKEITQITSFKQIKEIIEPIPAEKFCKQAFWMGPDPTNPKQCCFLGHIQLKLGGTASGNKNRSGYGARQLTARLLSELHDLEGFDGSDVNNGDNVNGYTEPEIKDRLMHMIEDGIKWEESKKQAV